MFSGYTVMASFCAQQAALASAKLASSKGKEAPEFHKAKIKLANFYFERMLPRTQGHAEVMFNPSKTMTLLAAEHFSFDYYVNSIKPINRVPRRSFSFFVDLTIQLPSNLAVALVFSHIF
jgi:UDP:flavonoid glycosyltransferase YjiC (YdhE family)